MRLMIYLDVPSNYNIIISCINGNSAQIWLKDRCYRVAVPKALWRVDYLKFLLVDLKKMKAVALMMVMVSILIRTMTLLL